MLQPTRLPQPSYPAPPYKQAVHKVREFVDNVEQQGKNIQNAVVEGYRRTKRFLKDG